MAALLAFVGVGVFRLRQRMAARSPAPPTPPVPVPPDEVELLEGPVSACMRCGSTRLRAASLSEGGIPGGGAMLAIVCARCGHRGPAIEFEDASAYRRFVVGLQKEET